MVWLCS